MTNTEIKNTVILHVQELLTKYNKENGTDIEPIPVKFDVKGTMGGKFCYGKTLFLDFNFSLLKDNFEHFMKTTVVHEVSHHIVYIVCGVLRSRNGNRIIHGKQWKRVMNYFGSNGTRCHSYDCSKVRTSRVQKRWSYTCDCGTDHQIATVTHNRIQRKQRSYTCKKCGSALRLV